VSMADSGGSTGRLRDEFGQLPVGDVRNALTALAAEGDEHDVLLRSLFQYRFNRGEGIAGHNFGNLLLTALTDMLGSEEEAIAAAGRILGVTGSVLPVTKDNVQLVAEYETGETVTGEALIDEPSPEKHAVRISSLSLSPRARLHPLAKAAIETADIVILGPGDLYTSILPNVVVDGCAQAIADTNAMVVYVANLMSKPGQTTGLHVKGHLDEIVRYTRRKPDHVIVNDAPLPADLVAKYETEGEHPIYNDCEDKMVSTHDLIATTVVTLPDGDVVRRSLIRHDPERLARVLLTYCDVTKH
jgi:uncharacterized cofD-like protein